MIVANAQSEPRTTRLQGFVSGELEVDAQRRIFKLRGVEKEPPPKVMELVLLLMTHHRRVVAKHEVVQHLWPDVHVSDNSLRWVLKEARRALEDDGQQQRFIRTRRGCGLRWVAPVAEVSALPTATGKAPELIDTDHVEHAADHSGMPEATALIRAARVGQAGGVVWLSASAPEAASTRDRLVEIARKAGVRVAQAACCTREQGAFDPWSALLSSVDGSNGAQLASAASAFETHGATGPDSEYASLTFWIEAHARLRRAVRSAPWMLVLSNLQLARRPALLMLRSVAAEFEDKRLVLLCCTHRGEQHMPATERDTTALRYEARVVDLCASR